MTFPQLPIPMPLIAEFCQKWNVTELALFGSVLRGDFGPSSDVDVLVSFERSARLTMSDVEDARRELEGIFGRRVDLLTREAVREHHNPWLKHAILSEATTVYKAA